MKRISNVNTFSSVIDRIIIESLKLIYFVENDNDELISHQNTILIDLNRELNIILSELLNSTYESIDEKRTYTNKNVFDDIFMLCLNNYNISVGDREKLKLVNDEPIDIQNLKKCVLWVRSNLEKRSEIKNNLEKIKNI
jgi:hypothetical protein